MTSQFPDTKGKLDAPTRKTAFERAKAEAEAKRQREAAETAAVYEDFVKSFEDDSYGQSSRYGNTDDRGGFGARGGHGAPRGPLGPSKRHFTGPGSTSRGGSYVNGPLTRKRDLESFRSENKPSNSRNASGLLGFDDPMDYEVRSAPLKSDKGIKFGVDEEEDNEDIKAASKEQAKPTIHLTQLPPRASKAMILEMLHAYFPNLTLSNITIQHSRTDNAAQSQNNTVRKAASALVTLHADTSASDIDAAVNGLASKYLGAGYRLSISRHLSSAVLGSASTAILSTQTAAPFNARQLFSHGPPGRGGFGGHRGGYAPPTSFAPGGSHQVNRFIVSVVPPKDIKTLKMIHQTVEAVLTNGPEFEALLMATPSVINDERFFWLWDNRSSEHVYYRWRLWDIITSGGSRGNRNMDRSYAGTSITHLFEGAAAWEIPPKKQQKFEYVTSIDDFIEDEEYHSSSDEDEDSHQAQDSNPSLEDTKTFLGPLKKTKLMHLLSRMPMTIGTLRRGDVARVTAFAVDNAYAAEEVVDALCENIARPVVLSTANPDHDVSARRNEEEDHDDDKEKEQKEDTTPAKMIALYLVSDVLSNSGLGVRNVWRYRQLFDQRLRDGKVFEGLAEVGVKENWGKIRQEKWRRSIINILTLWENWNIFPQTSHEAIRAAFSEPNANLQPINAPVKGDETTSVQEVTQAQPSAAKSRWKTVSNDEVNDQKPKFNPYLADQEEDVTAEQRHDLINEDVDGEAMDEDDEDVDGVPMDDEDDEEDEDVNNGTSDSGRAMLEDEEGKPLHQTLLTEAPTTEREDESLPVGGLTMGSGFGFKFGAGGKHGNTPTAGEEGRRKRMKAEDMFAADEDD